MQPAQADMGRNLSLSLKSLRKMHVKEPLLIMIQPLIWQTWWWTFIITIMISQCLVWNNASRRYVKPPFSRASIKSNVIYISIFSNLYSIDTHFDPSTIDNIRKHCGKRRNCSSRAISPFLTMFSTQSDDCIPFCIPFYPLLTSNFICCWIWKA